MNNTHQPLTFLEALFLLLVYMKVTHAIDANWWLVALPLFAPSVARAVYKTYQKYKNHE